MSKVEKQSDQPNMILGCSPDYLRVMIGFECAANVLRAFIDAVGSDRALQAIRPYSNNTGKGVADWTKKRLGLIGNDAETIAMTYYFSHCCTSLGKIKPLEIREGGAVVELFYCPAKEINAPPEACIAYSHYIAEGICEVINPEYEFVFTHHLCNYDDRCRYVVRKKSSVSDLNNLGKLEKTIPVLELPPQEIQAVNEMVGFGYHTLFTSASIDVIGSDRTMMLVAPFSRKTGLKLGNAMASNSGGKNDLLVTRDNLEFLCNVLKQNGAPARISDLGIEKEITECPFMKGPPQVCKQLEGVFNGACEAINPAYEFTYDRMMTKGDKTCHWVVRKKER